MREKLLILLFMIIAVPLAAELKFFPFNDTFRVSFGIPVFFFFLLFVRNINPVASGALVGLFILIFRVAYTLIMQENSTFINSVITYFPASFYYLAYSTLFYIFNVNRLHNFPLKLGITSVFIEAASSIIEIALRRIMLGNDLTLQIINEITIIAFIRSFFTLSFFYMIKLNETFLASERQKFQNKQMLLLISGLYEESVLLKKSTQNAEEVTRDCYNLYEFLRAKDSQINLHEVSQSLLGIAGEVHEIKKDNQRIYAGLSKIISSENPGDYMDMQDISEIIIHTNKKYAETLNKLIKFNLDIENNLPKLHAYTILSLINNLVSNSIESIVKEGIISITVCENNGFINFIVSDNGPGIPEKKQALIFKPGYTTKYDDRGYPSNGMGLPYVKELITKLNGLVTLKSSQIDKKTTFTIELPLISLIQKG